MKRKVWLLRTGFGIARVNKLVSLTWLLWALRSFRRHTSHYITCSFYVSLLPLSNHIKSNQYSFNSIECQTTTTVTYAKVVNILYCIVLYSSIYIAPLNSHRQTEALVVRLAPRKGTSFKK